MSLQNLKVEMKLMSRKVRGYRVPYQIKLFYTGNIPIILQMLFVQNIYFIAQILQSKFRGNFIVGLLGKWKDFDMAGHQAPIGGLAYYITPPQSLYDIQKDPVHAVVYIIFMMGSCAFFSRMWIDISGTSSRDIAKQLMGQDLFIEGMKENNEAMVIYLNRYIPIAASFGGCCIGALTIFADFMGAIGSGTGILLAVTIIYQYFEQIVKEWGKGTGRFIF